MTDSLLVRFKTDESETAKGFSASYIATDPFGNGEEDDDEEDLGSYSSEIVTPFPGSLKSIYKKESEDSEDTDDYSDLHENQLIINSPYGSRYQNY